MLRWRMGVALAGAIATAALAAPQRILIAGDLPSPANPPKGCNFNTRCPVRMDACFREPDPELVEVSPGHWVACHRVP